MEESNEEFDKRLASAVNSSYLTLALALGENVGLVDLLAEQSQPKTCQEIADIGKFKERYVREWLAAMVTANIVVYHPEAKTYFLSKERAGTIKNLQGLSLLVPVAAEGFAGLRKAFTKDGPAGNDMSVYNTYGDGLVAFDKMVYTDEFMTNLVKNIPGLERHLEEGGSICDVACGIGYVSLRIAQMYPKAKAIGFDNEQKFIERAKVKATGVTNVQYECFDFFQMPDEWSNRWDYMTFIITLHDLGVPSEGVKAISKLLKPGGVVGIVEFNVHGNLEDMIGNHAVSALYSLSLFKCVPLSMGYPGGGIGCGVFMPKDQIIQAIQDGGLKFEGIKQVHDLCLMYVCRKE